jgi:hypothetical protein
VTFALTALALLASTHDLGIVRVEDEFDGFDDRFKAVLHARGPRSDRTNGKIRKTQIARALRLA